MGSHELNREATCKSETCRKRTGAVIGTRPEIRSDCHHQLSGGERSPRRRRVSEATTCLLRSTRLRSRPGAEQATADSADTSVQRVAPEYLLRALTRGDECHPAAAPDTDAQPPRSTPYSRTLGVHLPAGVRCVRRSVKPQRRARSAPDTLSRQRMLSLTLPSATSAHHPLEAPEPRRVAPASRSPVAATLPRPQSSPRAESAVVRKTMYRLCFLVCQIPSFSK